MNIRISLIAALVSLCVSCNSEETAVLTNTADLPTASYTQYGVFALRRNSGTVFDAHSTFEGAFANFVELDAQFAADELLGYHRLAPDTCTTFQQPGDVIGNAGLIPVYSPLPSVDVTYISAGEILNLTSSSGTWLDVNRGQAPYYEYANVNPISEPMPALLKLSFPGDDFPEYGDIPVPEVADMTLSTPKAGATFTGYRVYVDCRYSGERVYKDNG